VAGRKIQTLLDFGAGIIALDPEPSDILEALALEQRVSLIRRVYAGPEDLAGQRLVIAASNDREVNHRVSGDAQALGIPVNVADDPEACTFFFPAIVRRGDLVAGISSSGRSPRFTARLRERLDKQWPAEWEDALDQLAAERKRLRQTAEKNAKLLPILDELIDRLFAGENLP
jgi:siroheme synthase-like protein